MEEQEREELAHLPRRGEIFEVQIEAMGDKGVGIARRAVTVGPDKSKRTLRFEVQRTIPGDVVRVEAIDCRRSVVRCKRLELLEAAADRIEPRCRHFGLPGQPDEGCGGCVLQQMDYGRQLELKQQLVQESFEAVGLGHIEARSIIGMEQPWYFRNKMEYSFGDNYAGEYAVGMHPTGFKWEIIRQRECFLQSPFSAQLVCAVRDWAATAEIPVRKRGEGFLENLVVREGKRSGQRLVELVTAAYEDRLVPFEGAQVPAQVVVESFQRCVEACAREHDEALDAMYWTERRVRRGEPTRRTSHHLMGRETLLELLRLPGDVELRFEIHPQAFFQPNTAQAERLYAETLQRTGLLEGGKPVVLDLYCGTGTIGLCMAPFAERVVGVELVAQAVENARANAALNGLENLEFFVGDAGEVLRSEAFVQAVGGVPPVTVIDPPRGGLHGKAIKQVMALRSPRLVYVSCNPISQARDCAQLVEEGGYRLLEMQPVDQFAHSMHVENVALLEL